MGCTSSARTTMPPNANTADKSIQFEEDSNEGPSIEVDVADTEENKMYETTVLPSCDTEHPVQLARNNKSTNSLTIEKDVPGNGHVMESEDVTEPPTVQNEVKIPKLELLMDKVFETNQHLNGTDQKSNDLTINDEEQHETEKSEETNTNENSENKGEEQETAETENSENTGNPVENKELGEEQAEAEETSSSQSMSSRATRWEALADIAAELPPSLAVDPITGQIYQIALPK